MVRKKGLNLGAAKFLAAFILALITVFAMGVVASAAEYKVSTPEEIASVSASAKPGDVLVMKNGTWNNAQILFQGKGTEQQPITLRAETPGNVIITGESYLKIAGSYLVVDGLVFKNVYATSKIGLIEFSNKIDDKRIYSDHCRLTNTVMIDCNPPEEMTDYKWVSLYGQYNRVDHSYFKNKTNIGTLLVVWRDDESPNYHQIDNNYFGYTGRHSVNGGETIRVGDSKYPFSDSFTVVENNFFDNCNGDIEVISNKSSNNTFKDNTFFECEGALSLRHGNNATVEGNYFIQNHLPISVGVRVMGESHKIINNYFYGIGESGGTMRAAIDIFNGIPDSPNNGYHQVKNVLIANNTFVDNEKNIMIGGGKSSKQNLPPVDITVKDNIILSRYSPIVDVIDDTSKITYKNNMIFGTELGIKNDGGFVTADPTLNLDENGIFRAAAGSDAAKIGSQNSAKPLTANDVGPLTINMNGENYNVKVNGKSLNIGQIQKLSDGSVMLPVRTVAAALGVKVKWDEVNSSVVLYKPDSIITFKLGESKADVNGKSVSFVTATKLINDRTMVPVKFVNDLLAKKAEWDSKTKTVSIDADLALVFDADAEKKIAEMITAKAEEQAANSGSISVAAVTASGDDGNVPPNTIDGDLTTRWAASGIGQWIMYDLGKVQKVESIGISFNKGNERVTSFQIDISNDGKEWKTIFDGLSDGKTKGIESIKVEPFEAQYVKLIGKGTVNNADGKKGEWFSIFETEFKPGKGTVTTPPAVTPAPSSTPAPSVAPVPSATPAPVSGSEQAINPSDDTYVEKGKDTVNGAANLLRIKGTTDGTIVRISYLKFKVENPSSVTSAIFQISGKISDSMPDGTKLTYDVYGLTDDSWSETTAIWTNTPNHAADDSVVTGVGDTATYIGSFTMDQKGNSKAYTVDVTEFVKAHKDQYVTFMIIDTQKQNGNTDNYPKERKTEEDRPVLKIK